MPLRGDVRGAVVFDLDGTLVDSTEVAAQAYVRTLADLGVQASAQQVRDVWDVRSTSQVLAHFLRRPCRASELELYGRTAVAALTDAPLFPGITSLLDHLERVGYALGVLTGAARVAADAVLARHGIATRFGAVLCGDEGIAPKPSPEGLLAVCARLGVSPATTAYVGDTATDLACASAAGVRGIAAAWRPGSHPDAVGDDPPLARTPSAVVDVLGAGV
ncbi:HAD family hydrolase [Mumia sp. DW29H23]|uniref:HAD family hydrolase n=1 Tax=Mumia sp. DW29H23 TaxID=3421241 RepID=UPI003D6909CC